MSENDSGSKYLAYVSLGAEIAVALTVPILLGYWLDNYFELSPWLLLIGCLIGMINFFVLIFQLNKRLNKK